MSGNHGSIGAGVYLFDLWVSLVEKGIMNIYTLKWVVQATAVVLQLVLYGVFLVTLYFALKRIAGSFKDKEQKIQRTELYFLLTPGMAGLLSVFYSVKLFQDMTALNREKSSRMILEKQVGSMQEHMAETERVYAGINSMRHDMKNTLTVVMQLAGEEKGFGGSEADHAELQSYLSELNRTFDSLECRFKTENNVVDTLLNMKYHEAVRNIPDL